MDKLCSIQSIIVMQVEETENFLWKISILIRLLHPEILFVEIVLLLYFLLEFLEIRR